jgi:beta-lactamase regulating signal transducer with metallopeptidase domain
MNDLLILWLSLSLSGSLVALTLILLKPLLQRFSKTWKYYLWLLVILRLLIPFSPDLSIVGSLFQEAKTHFAVLYTPVEETPEINHSVLAETQNIPGLENNTPQKPQKGVTDFSFARNHLLGTIWLAVAIILLIRKMYGYGQFMKAVKKESKIVYDGQIPAVLKEVSTAMGIKKRTFVCTNSLVRVPMLIGIIKPMIVLPAKAINKSELVYIFRHELTHYRRIDFLYKWLTEIAVCLHWFNPFAYWVRKQINQDCEFSCDETVISCLGDTERQSYGETLLNSIVINNIGRADIVSLSLSEDGKLIKERLYAIMQYRRKSKFIVFITAILTSVLLCGTVYAGAYTVAAVENVKTSAVASPIRINNKDLAPGGKISLGSQSLLSGTTCQVLLTWTGNGNLTVLCTSSKGVEKSYPIENSKVTTFQIDVDGEYTIAVKNSSISKNENVNGSIRFEQSAAKHQSQNTANPAQSNTSTGQTVVYENVEMRRYEGENGHPYIHEIKTNNTTKKVVGCQQGMLAFDKDGNPLEIDWWSLDTELDNTYFYFYEGDSSVIASDETSDVIGGWSLNFFGEDLAVDKIAYVLYCDKEITFEDGTVWKSPDFEKWLATYEGRKTDVNVLKNYYPYEQKISF